MKLPPIIEVAELHKIYKDRDVIIFDVSNHASARVNYEVEHLEGAIFMDVNLHLSDSKEDAANGGRHPLPPIDSFTKVLALYGVTPEKHIVVYDDKGGANAAARFWWMLRAIGHDKVQVLNGGYAYAKKCGFPISGINVEPVQAVNRYLTTQWLLSTITIDKVRQASEELTKLIIDVREVDRYEGRREPLDLEAGHIPNAINVPFSENLNSDGLFLPPNILKEKYVAIFGEKQPMDIIIHCGSGVTACHSLLALDYAGIILPNLYVGSWSEWSRNGLKMVRNSRL